MNSIYKILTVLFVFTFTNGYAQDGEAIFKSKCNVCHMLEKDGTGPNLKNVREKWDEAGELDMIYDWVKNPPALIESGKSTMAIKADQYSKTGMTAQDVSLEEMNAVFDYVDNYVAPVVTETPNEVPDGEKQVVVVANYKRNLNLFYILLVGIFVQLIAIFSLSSTIKEFIRKNAGKSTKMIIVGFVTLFAANSYALEFMSYGQSQEDVPWLKVENSDLMILGAANLLLAVGIMYLYNMFTSFNKVIRPEYFEAKVKKQESKRSILTDAVPIEEEESILMHHDYDGIRELDNNLPPWWVWMFYATIIFGVIYIFNYHILGTADLQIKAYEKSMEQAEIEVSEYKEKMGMQIDETNAELMTDESELQAGGKLFQEHCIACHKADGSGEIGPNLTDKSWIYGYEIGTVFGIISNGTNNGMIPHKGKMNPIQIQQVASFVLSMPEKSGKQAEGDIIEQ